MCVKQKQMVLSFSWHLWLSSVLLQKRSLDDMRFSRNLIERRSVFSCMDGKLPAPISSRSLGASYEFSDIVEMLCDPL